MFDCTKFFSNDNNNFTYFYGAKNRDFYSNSAKIVTHSLCKIKLT